MSPIEKAVVIAGGQAALARKIGKTPSFVSQLVSGRRPVPPALCGLIEAAVGRKVSREELRPDVFGEVAA